MLSLENAMAHQRYLEQLSFEAHCLRRWTRMTAEKINDKGERGHHQLAKFFWTASPKSNKSMLGQAMGPGSMAPPPLHPQMGQMHTQIQLLSRTLQVKPAPVPRTSGAQTSSSASAPSAHQQCPSREGNDLWMKGWNEMHK